MAKYFPFYFLVALAFGFVFGFGFKSYLENKKNSFVENVRGSILREGGYQFINPILACEIAEKGAFTELTPIENNIRELTDKFLKQGSASDISVYVRSLNSGRWLGVNEDKKYTPASLMKVFLMTAYFKVAETNPSILSKKIYYDGLQTDTGSLDNTLKVLEAGRYYTVQELIEKMVIYSSNQALNLLIDNFDNVDPKTRKALDDLLTDLNISLPDFENESNFDYLSPKTYSFIFRILYGSTFLNREMSERTLKLLTETEFKDGLVNGIPSDIAVAHKFGAIDIAANRPNLRPIKELHDCGIVYYPLHPFLLCVMTRGSDFSILKTVISEITARAYSEFSAFYSAGN